MSGTIPKVMSASSVTACGDTSEGSTAAKLEVASPKSPTIENENHVSQKILRLLQHILHTLAISLRI